MIYKTIDTAEQLREEFKKYGRDSYSLDGYQAMLDYLKEFNTNDLKIDVVGLNCNFTEDDFGYFIGYYSLEEELKELCEDDEPTEDDYKEVISNYLDYKGTYYTILDNTVFYQVI
jgi:hypothetical protein